MSDTVRSSASDLLTQQFYNWEIRGRGWMVWPDPVELEPPFRPFEGHVLPPSFFTDDGRQGTFFTSIADRFRGLLGVSTPTLPDDSAVKEPDANALTVSEEEIIELQLSLPREMQPSPDVFEQCVFSLAYCRSPISFEVFGDKTTLTVQVVCRAPDANSVFSQLKNHFPDAVITPVRSFLADRLANAESLHTEIHEFGLEREFMLPLRLGNELAVDPMVTLCGALEQLYETELGILQILFEPVRNRWTENAWNALTTNDGDAFFEGEKDMLALAKRKLTSPLFAVVVRVGAIADEEKRAWEIIRSVAGVMRLFDSADGNRLTVLENDGYSEDDHRTDLLNRCSHRCGMLLNSDELISIAHLPTAAVRSRKLTREIKRTKEVPESLTREGVWLGVNKHEGKETFVRLPDTSRTEHMHVIGTQGTGKSTLLLNLICQDIYNGRGCAVLDPHGDLIDEVLSYIPPERYRDVILVDPSDEVYPIGFNILSAHSTIEKNLLASDLVAVFRRLSTSWGDQMNSVLGNAVLAFLENSRVGTLPELRRFFVEPAFRKEILATVTDPDIVYYWEKEFPVLKTNSLGPLLTRLDMFLRPKTIRYMVGQRENKLDFGGIMNDGKILLARLSQGIIGEENGFLLGTLLVSKFHQLAISRQAVESQERRPFYLYIDEFHHFVTPSMASILTGVRKYRLGLILAHQNLTQLRDADVANAVLSSPYTRVCFRVGDQDAKRVAESLSFFEPSDILSLGKGEAVCRIQKNDWDFNLETIVPPKPEPEQAKQRRQYLQYLTRVQYGMAREKVEEELAKTRVEVKRERVDPFAARSKAERPSSESPDAPKPTPAKTSPKEAEQPPPKDELERIEKFYAKPETQPNPPPTQQPSSEVPNPPTTNAVTDSKENTPRVPASLGRGGAQHKSIQERLQTEANKLGFTAGIEGGVAAGTTQAADLVLRKGPVVIAVEITITTTTDHEFGNVKKCLNAGFPRVAVVSPQPARLEAIAQAVRGALDANEIARVSYFTPEAFIAELKQIAAETAAPSEFPKERVVGQYKVRRSVPELSDAERKAKEAIAYKVVTEAAKKK